MVSLYRTFNNIRRGGIKAWYRQMWYIGDAKFGRLVGQDHFGNKYYENTNPVEEVPGRHRWIDFAQHDYNASQVPPEWHSWLGHIRELPPHEDPIIAQSTPPWKTIGDGVLGDGVQEAKRSSSSGIGVGAQGEHADDTQPAVENLTGTRGRYVTYSTTAPKIRSWEPTVAQRGGQPKAQ